MRAYLQILHGLIERLSEQSKNCENANPQDKLEEVEKETRKYSNSLSGKAPRMHKINIEKE